jgi:GNAT superfamily N-acetyltransferase
MATFFAGGAANSGQRSLFTAHVAASDRLMQDPSSNSAVLLDSLATADKGEVVSNIRRFYAQSSSPWLLWSAWPDCDLAPFGLVSVSEPPLMLRESISQSLKPGPDVEIREVNTREGLEDFSATFTEAYPLNDPPIRDKPLFREGMLGSAVRFWNAYRNGRCVGVSSACLSDGVLTVNAVAIHEHVRGQGIGTALTEIAARSAPGYPVLLMASDLGRPVYEKIGFREIGRFRLWMEAPSNV